MVDIEQGRTTGSSTTKEATSTTLVTTNARKRLQLNIPVQSPAKPFLLRLEGEKTLSYQMTQIQTTNSVDQQMKLK
jgi:hypothetical protein